MARPPALFALILLLACGHAGPGGEHSTLARGSGRTAGFLAAGGRAEPPAPPRAGQRIREPAGPRRAPVGGRMAVVVGIDRYRDARDLTAAVSDARLVAQALRHLGFEDVRLLAGHRATRTAILGAVRDLARADRGGQPGVFFFAGHVRQVDGDPDRDGEDLDEAMLTADGRLLYDGDLARALRTATGPLWLAYAGCFAGGFADAARAGRVSSYASPEHRLAYESPQLGNSFMVEFLVGRALLGRGIHEVEDMHAFASNQMRGRYRRFRPVHDDRVRGSLDLGEPAPPPAEEQGEEPVTCLLGC